MDPALGALSFLFAPPSFELGRSLLAGRAFAEPELLSLLEGLDPAEGSLDIVVLEPENGCLHFRNHFELRI